MITYKKSINIQKKKLIKFLCDVTTDYERSRMVPDPIAHSPCALLPGVHAIKRTRVPPQKIRLIPPS